MPYRNRPADRAARRELINWAKRQPLEALNFTHMQGGDRKRLRRIQGLWAERQEEANEQHIAPYDRFLASLGRSRKDVGVRRREAGSRAEIKAMVLKALDRPRSSKSLVVRAVEGKKRGRAKRKIITRGIASRFSINPILTGLFEEGKLKREMVAGRMYYFKPRQGKYIRGLRARAVRFALYRIRKGEALPGWKGKPKEKPSAKGDITTIRFGEPEIREAVMQRLDRPMIKGELLWVNTEKGTRVMLCSGKQLSAVLEDFVGKGKLRAREIGGRTYYYRWGHGKQLKEIEIAQGKKK